MDKSEYRELLLDLRDNWTNEIPEEIVDSRSGMRLKARSGWFNSVHIAIATGINRGYLNPNIESDNTRFIESVKGLNHGRRATRIEIDLGNRLLGRAILQLD